MGMVGSSCYNIRGVSKKSGEWYNQNTNKTEDTNKLTLLAFKIIAILQNTLLHSGPEYLKSWPKFKVQLSLYL
jgi:hypothetical protein